LEEQKKLIKRVVYYPAFRKKNIYKFKEQKKLKKGG